MSTMSKEAFEVAYSAYWYKGKWTVDVEEGLVKGKHGSYGYLKNGYPTFNLRVDGKLYRIKRAEIILIAAHYNPTDLIVMYKDGNRENTRFDNLNLIDMETMCAVDTEAHTQKNKERRNKRARHRRKLNEWRERDEEYLEELERNKKWCE